jgi:DNA anti-recombination protein RmuC
VHSHNEYDSQEDLIFCTVTEDGVVLPSEFSSSLLQIIPENYSKTTLEIDDSITGLFMERLQELLDNLSEKTNEYISFEIDKFESWSEDQVYKIQSEVIELRKQHDAVRRQLRKETNARIKLALKEQEVKLAKELRQKQQRFFEMQDQCADQVDQLTERLRKSMESVVEHSILFKFSWQII